MSVLADSAIHHRQSLKHGQGHDHGNNIFLNVCLSIFLCTIFLSSNCQGTNFIYLWLLVEFCQVIEISTTTPRVLRLTSSEWTLLIKMPFNQYQLVALRFNKLQCTSLENPSMTNKSWFILLPSKSKVRMCVYTCMYMSILCMYACMHVCIYVCI